ncbi:MAG: thioredoxin domain-containing protein, partial [Nitrosopumilus sp.]|nr:thioredoxin domain-containing protein [Nitrosopumilus sp.]
LGEHNNLHVKIIFTATNDKDDIRFLPVRHLLAIAENKNEATTKEALDDWYLSEKKDYDDFALQYPMNGELLMQENKIEAMHKWCKEMNVKVTPTIFINGFQLPEAYTIEDLKYFLLE